MVLVLTLAGSPAPLRAAGIVSATLRAIGDDSYETWFNGHPLGEGGGYSAEHFIDVPVDWIVPGQNVLANLVHDRRGGALWVEYVLEIELSDGTHVDIKSDGAGTRQLDTGLEPPTLPAGWTAIVIRRLGLGRPGRASRGRSSRSTTPPSLDRSSKATWCPACPQSPPRATSSPPSPDTWRTATRSSWHQPRFVKTAEPAHAFRRRRAPLHDHDTATSRRRPLTDVVACDELAPELTFASSAVRRTECVDGQPFTAGSSATWKSGRRAHDPARGRA